MLARDETFCACKWSLVVIERTWPKVATGRARAPIKRRRPSNDDDDDDDNQDIESVKMMLSVVRE